jgi:hypothetical protein
MREVKSKTGRLNAASLLFQGFASRASAKAAIGAEIVERLRWVESHAKMLTKALNRTTGEFTRGEPRADRVSRQGADVQQS